MFCFLRNSQCKCCSYQGTEEFFFSYFLWNSITLQMYWNPILFSMRLSNSCYRSCAHGQSLLCLQLCADKANGQYSGKWPRLCVKTANNSDKSYSRTFEPAQWYAAFFTTTKKRNGGQEVCPRTGWLCSASFTFVLVLYDTSSKKLKRGKFYNVEAVKDKTRKILWQFRFRQDGTGGSLFHVWHM